MDKSTPAKIRIFEMSPVEYDEVPESFPLCGAIFFQMFYIDKYPGVKQTQVVDKSIDCKWHDEDDNLISVDLSKFAKSKTLKKEVSDHIINGAEYASRLHQNWEILTGRPKWIGSTHSVTSFSFDSCYENDQLLPDIIELERLLDVTHSSASKVCSF